ncbi:MAG: epoxide hydrolase family protein [Micromonosporaceae bacterium]
MKPVPYRIHVDDAVLADLRRRIHHTRWPDPAPGEPWQQGTDLTYLQELLGYWADGYDWRAAEAALNRYPHYRVELGGATIHFVHVKTGGTPLVVTHGWPSSFAEPLALVEHAPGFDLVIPSLPGYGFSPRPDRQGVNYRYVAGLWHQLMRGLGYQRYGAAGGDFGGGVAAIMALDDPDPLIGIHLTDMDVTPYTGEGAPPLSPAERAYLEHQRTWWAAEGGYKAIQSTKPQTLGYALTDSPAGLAAWVLEKWRSWADSGGDLGRLDRDALLTHLTIYWATGTITSSMRDYYDNRWHPVTLGPHHRVRVPTGFAIFGHQYIPEGEPPREYAERLYDVRRWTVMPRGGHFAAAEAPELLAAEIGAFFGDL